MKPKFDRIVVAGAGGVGYWLVIALCRELEDIPIEVYDPDTFEGGNGFLRLPKVTNPRAYKVDILRAHIAFFMGNRVPVVHTKYLGAEDFLKGDWSTTLVVDCTDMGQSAREQFWEDLERVGAKGLRVSYDGLGLQTISPGPPMSAEKGGEGGGGYNIMPNLPQSFGAAGLGAQAVLYMLYTGEPLDFQVHVPTYRTRSVVIERSLFDVYSNSV